MAIINVDDAYILNETGAQVDKTTGIPFKNESLTEAEAAQARANIRAGGSNDNLLDNAYFVGGGSQLGDGVFPINQRGQTSYSGTGNTIDRWKCNDPVGVLSLSASGISITVGTQFCGYQQYLPMGALVEGETYTLSIKINGTVYSWTIPSLSTAGQSQYAGWFGNSNIYSYIGVLNGKWQIMPFDSATGTLTTVSGVQAMKLEKGTVSTLANDAPPDYWKELEACQRYFYYRVCEVNTAIAEGTVYNPTTVVFDLVLPVAMNKTNAITFGQGGSWLVYCDGNIYAVTGMNVWGTQDNHVQLIVQSENLPQYKSATLIVQTGTCWINLSREP